MRSTQIFKTSVIEVLEGLSNTILALVVRRYFLMYLGSEIQGLNSLYASILGFICLSELGVGNSIVMCLYKPIVEDDKETIKSYVHFLKKYYHIIGLIIMALCCCMVPFLKYMVTGDFKQDFIVISFLLYALSYAVSYIFGYKNIILFADQKIYIESLGKLFNRLFTNVGGLIVILLFKSYYLYVAVMIVCHFLYPYFVGRQADKLYPYLKEEAKPLDKEKKNDLLDKVRGLLSYKVSNQLIEGTDNIIISMTIGTVYVGYYSNYYLIINMLISIFGSVSSAATSALGNLLYIDKVKMKRAFNRLQLMQLYLYGFSLSGFILLSSSFINFVFPNTKTLSLTVIMLMASIYYLKGYSQPLESIRSCTGVYKEKSFNIFIAILNLVISYVLAFKLGIAGVLIGTIVSYFIKELIIAPIMVYKNVFDERLINYYLKFINDLVIALIILAINSYLINNIIVVDSIVKWLISGVICLLTSAVIISLIYGRTIEFKEILDLINTYLKKIFKGKKIA